MTKVCFIVSSLCNEGPVNVIYNIIQYMDFSIFDVSIVTLIPEKVNSRLEEFKSFPIKIYQIASENKCNLFSLYLKLKSTINAINPDILHAHCPRSLYLMNFLPKKFKKIYTIHIYPGLQQEILYGKTKGRIVNFLNHYFTKRVDKPIGCAESVGELYRKNKKWDIECIPNGSSLPLWKESSTHKDEIRKRLGLKDGIKYFIFIGRFSKEKNPELIIDSFRKNPREDIGVIMLGNGPLWNQLKGYESERIILPGFKTNIYEYLIASDYYISASDVEGLANTLLESMTVGLPLLLSNIPSHHEVINKMSKCVGYIYNQKNAEEIDFYIDKILALDKKEVSDEIRRVFTQYYTAKLMSEKYQKIYQSINM